MFGLGLSTARQVAKKIFSPIRIRDLVVWYDFGDKRTIYTDAGTTNVSSDGDKVYRITNKANANSSKILRSSIGAYLEQSTAANRPVWRAASGGCVAFSNSLSDTQKLYCSKSVGNTATNSLSATTVNGQNLTVFYVAQANGSTVGSDEYLMNIFGANIADRISIYVDNDTNDRWQSHVANNTARSNTVVNCGQNLTTDKEVSCVGFQQNSRFYRNNNTADGTTSGSSDDHDIDLSTNDAGIKLSIGEPTGIGTTGFNGKVFEFLIFDRALSTGEEKLVNTYLRQKHKI